MKIACTLGPLLRLSGGGSTCVQIGQQWCGNESEVRPETTERKGVKLKAQNKHIKVSRVITSEQPN